MSPPEDPQIVPVDGTLDRVALSAKMASVRRGERSQLTVLPAKNVDVLGHKTPRLRLPPLTSARNTRRALARVVSWILDGKIDDAVGARVGFLLGGIAKILEIEQAAALERALKAATAAQVGGEPYRGSYVDGEDDPQELPP